MMTNLPYCLLRNIMCCLFDGGARGKAARIRQKLPDRIEEIDEPSVWEYRGVITQYLGSIEGVSPKVLRDSFFNRRQLQQLYFALSRDYC